MNSDIIKKIALYFIDRPEAVTVYLFGSHARGREKRFSDIDLGVLLEREMLARQSDLDRTEGEMNVGTQVRPPLF